MKKILIVAAVTCLINVVFLFSQPDRIFSVGAVSESRFINHKKDLDLISERLNSEIGSDHVWLWLFHNNIDDMFGEEFSLGIKAPYMSSPYIWHGEGLRITANTRNILISEFPDMTETFSGKCLARLTKQSDLDLFDNLSNKNLVIRCPLYDTRNAIIGVFGVTVLNYELSLFQANVQQYIKTVKEESKNATTVLFE